MNTIDKTKSLPFRQGIGMVILNKDNKIFVGQRIDSKLKIWQMPQGGILTGETPSKALFREMKEELGSNKAEIIAESKKWYSYHIPDFLISKLWNGQYKGQKQKWFLLKFYGEDDEIKIQTEEPEFKEWKWVNKESLFKIAAPFKQKLYKEVIAEFGPFLK